MFVEMKKDGELQAPINLWRSNFLQAAEIIRHVGHCKGLIFSKDGRVCMIGALAITFDDHNNFDVLGYERAIEHLTCRLGREPISWNDDNARTPEQVIAALEAAAI